MAQELCNPISTINANQGDACNLGYEVGMIVSEVKNSALAKSAAALRATFTGSVTSLQQKDKTSGRVFVVNFAKATPGTTESVKWVKDNGNAVITNVTTTDGTYDVEGGVCAFRSLYAFFKNQKTVYVYFIMSTGALVGQEITAGTIEQIKCAINAIPVKGTTAEPSLVRLSISEMEKYVDRIAAILPEAGFEYSDLVESNVSDLVFTEVSNTLTTVVVDVTTPCGAAVTDLSLTGNSNKGWFLLRNTTDSADVAPSGVTAVGNRYTVTFGAQTEADKAVLYYSLPSATNEPYELIQDNGLSVTLTA